MDAFQSFWDQWKTAYINDGDSNMDAAERHARAAWNEALILAGRGMAPILRDMISRGHAFDVCQKLKTPHSQVPSK